MFAYLYKNLNEDNYKNLNEDNCLKEILVDTILVLLDEVDDINIVPPPLLLVYQQMETIKNIRRNGMQVDENKLIDFEKLVVVLHETLLFIEKNEERYRKLGWVSKIYRNCYDDKVNDEQCLLMDIGVPAEAEQEECKTKEYDDLKIIDLTTCIDDLIERTKRFNDLKSFLDLKNNLDDIMFYFRHPNKVLEASSRGGLYNIQQKYEPELLRIKIIMDERISINLRQRVFDLNDEQRKKIARVLTLGAQQLKVKKAYANIRKGRKFQKAGIDALDNGHHLSQPNIIKTLSEDNLNYLIKKLKSRQNSKSFGLLADEIDLFACLLNLPYKLQHATNYYYPIANSGSIDSYAEIKRINPDYKSPFSTKGNVENLGNDGFVFFRVYVDGANTNVTRYGDTSIQFDISILHQMGWVSLHDQLRPLSTPNAKHFYRNKRLLRMAKVCDGDGSNNKLKTKIKYCYRKDHIESYSSGRKDTLKSFGNTIQMRTRKIKFTREIFYGKDILRGIALSIIYELWLLKKSGFRDEFLKEFKEKTGPDRVLFAADFIKSVFRIEGKYPVSLKLNVDRPQCEKGHITEFIVDKSIIGEKFTVINPEGDERYNPDMSVNRFAMRLAQWEGSKFILEADHKVANRFLQKRLKNVKVELEKISKMLDASMEIRECLIKYFRKHFPNNFVDNESKELTAKLYIIKNKYLDFLSENSALLPVLISFSANILLQYYSLLKYDETTLQIMQETSLNELKAIGEYVTDIFKQRLIPIPLDELIKFYRKNSNYLVYLSWNNDDIAAEIYDVLPNTDEVLWECAELADIDVDDIVNELDESDRIAYDMSQESDGNDFDEQQTSAIDGTTVDSISYHDFSNKLELPRKRKVEEGGNEIESEIQEPPIKRVKPERWGLSESQMHDEVATGKFQPGAADLETTNRFPICNQQAFFPHFERMPKQEIGSDLALCLGVPKEWGKI
jgi:hypothetical protein